MRHKDEKVTEEIALGVLAGVGPEPEDSVQEYGWVCFDIDVAYPVKPCLYSSLHSSSTLVLVIDKLLMQ